MSAPTSTSTSISTRSRYVTLAAWLLIASLCIRFVVWYLELSYLIPAMGFTSMLAIATMLIVMLRTIRTRRRQWTAIDWLSLATLLYCSGVMYLGYLKHGDYIDSNDKSFTAYNMTVLLQSVLYYAVGRFFLGDAMVRRKLLFYSWATLSVFILANSNLNPLGLNLDRMDENTRGIYLALADMYALLSFVIVATEPNWGRAGRLVFASAAILLLLHSRGAFLIFLAAATFQFIAQLDARRFLKMAIWTICCTVPVIVLGWDYIAANERMASILLDPLNDSSLQSRLLQLLGGIEDIVNYPFSGRYGGQIEMYGYIGWYIHSVLSYWRQFGFVPFIGVLILSVWYPWHLLRTRHGLPSQHRNLLLTLLVYCTIQSIFVKAYEWYFLWMFVGYVGWLHRSAPQRRRVPDYRWSPVADRPLADTLKGNDACPTGCKPNLTASLFDPSPMPRSGRIVLEIASPEWVRAGIGGVFNTVFFGEAFANFGKIGLLLSPFIVVLVYTAIALGASLLPYNLRVAFLVHAAMNTSAMAGFNDFLWNPFLIVVFVILLIASRVKPFLSYVVRPAA